MAITYTYQWQRDTAGNNVYSNIGGATSNTYVLQAADVRCNVRCVVTATDGGSTDANSNSVGPIFADVTGAIVLPITVVRSVVGGIAISYQWRRDILGDLSFSRVTGATASTYLLTADDVGCHLLCDVTATSSGGSSTARSNIVGPVTSVITGQVVTPLTLTVVTNALPGTITLSYQWQRRLAGDTLGSKIAGATSNTYVLQAADVGAFILCEVTATNAHGTTVASSNEVGPVQAGAQSLTGQVAVGITDAISVHGSIPRAPQIAAAGLIYQWGDFIRQPDSSRTDLVFGVVTNGRRDVRGQVASPITFRAVTVADGDPHRGKVRTDLALNVTTVAKALSRGVVPMPIQIIMTTIGVKPSDDALALERTGPVRDVRISALPTPSRVLVASSGETVLANALGHTAAGNLPPIAPADPVHDRIDVIAANAAGALSIIQGPTNDGINVQVPDIGGLMERAQVYVVSQAHPNYQGGAITHDMLTLNADFQEPTDIQVFDDPAGGWWYPPIWATTCRVIVIGGGGGGGGGRGGTGSGGGGGGGGAFTEGTFTIDSIVRDPLAPVGALLKATAGLGGSGGLAQADGRQGTTSFFGNVLFAGGGGGGAAGQPLAVPPNPAAWAGGGGGGGVKDGLTAVATVGGAGGGPFGAAAGQSGVAVAGAGGGSIGDGGIADSGGGGGGAGAPGVSVAGRGGGTQRGGGGGGGGAATVGTSAGNGGGIGGAIVGNGATANPDDNGSDGISPVGLSGQGGAGGAATAPGTGKRGGRGGDYGGGGGGGGRGSVAGGPGGNGGNGVVIITSW